MYKYVYVYSRWNNHDRSRVYFSDLLLWNRPVGSTEFCSSIHILECCKLNFIVLDGNLTIGHQKNDMNPNCICLVMNVPKHYCTLYLNIFHWAKDGCRMIFFQTKKFLKDLRYQLMLFRFTFNRGLALAKTSALVYLQVININGKSY